MNSTNYKKAIFSQRLAGYLMMQGFVLLGMSEDKKKGHKNIFFFNDTPELHKAIWAYSKR